jgi:hypothetical protein
MGGPVSGDVVQSAMAEDPRHGQEIEEFIQKNSGPAVGLNEADGLGVAVELEVQQDAGRRMNLLCDLMDGKPERGELSACQPEDLVCLAIRRNGCG